MAIGVYPIPPPDPKLIDQILSENMPPPEPKIMSFFAQLEHISTAPAPRLEHKTLSPEFTDFLDKCLQKESVRRADLKTLLVICEFRSPFSVLFYQSEMPNWTFISRQNHAWIKKYEKESVDIAGWVSKAMKMPRRMRNWILLSVCARAHIQCPLSVALIYTCIHFF